MEAILSVAVLFLSGFVLMGDEPKPDAAKKVTPRRSRGYFRLARNSTRSRKSRFDRCFMTSSGIADLPRARSSMFAFGTVTSCPSAVISLTSFASSLLDDAADYLAVGQRQHDRFEALGDLLVGVHDRLQQVLARLLAADAGQVRADVAALPLTLWQRRQDTSARSEEDASPGLHIAADQGSRYSASGSSFPGSSSKLSSFPFTPCAWPPLPAGRGPAQADNPSPATGRKPG